jgi:CRISPR-associated exonuclease Cas4
MTEAILPDAIPEDSLIPIRYINDVLFCERRAALHLNEQIWKDNQFTMEGLLSHKRVDVPRNRKRGDLRDITGMWLVSYSLGLIGKSDLIEMHSAPDGSTFPYPVEFKRGKKRRWDNNEAQLCAQALCLEEMMNVSIPCGAIFHVKSQHREEVVFDEALRSHTIDAARRLRQLVDSRQTPQAKYHPKCKGCSLFEWCMPKSLRPRATASRYLESIVEDSFAMGSDSL